MTAMDWAAGAACQDEDPALFFPPSEDDDAMDWATLARCVEVDWEIFFPPVGGRTREAKKVCARCEVRTECGDYATARPYLLGVWGGLSERQRKHLRNPTPDGEPVPGPAKEAA